MKVTTRYGTFEGVPEQNELEQAIDAYWQAYADMLAAIDDAIEYGSVSFLFLFL